MNARLAAAVLALGLAARAAAQDEGALSVPLPDGFPTLPGSEHAAFYAVIGKQLAEGLVGDASVLFDAPGAECDRVLLLGGPLARWAHRTADGIWSWDASGLVVAGKLPEKFRGAYVDVLAALDGQVEPPVDGLYPTFSATEIEGDVFVIGVPAPGHYDLILDAAHGKVRALATCEAVPAAGLDVTQLAVVEARDAEFRLALSVPAKLAHGAPPTLSLREYYRHMTLDASATATRVAGGFTVPVDPRVLGGKLWAWAPGWRALLVEGKEFSEKQPAVARTVEPGKRLLVRVKDRKGAPVEKACVELRDADGKPLVAAFDPRGNESVAQLDTTGRVSSSGELTLFGLPPGGVKLSVGPCGTGAPATVVTWDGMRDTIDVVVE